MIILIQLVLLGKLFPLHQVSTKFIVVFAGRTDVEIVPNWINQCIVWAIKQMILHKRLITSSVGARYLIMFRCASTCLVTEFSNFRNYSIKYIIFSDVIHLHVELMEFSICSTIILIS